MRLATWKLAALMGVVPTIGCVQKIVPSDDGTQLGNDDAGVEGMMDATVMQPMMDAGKPDAGKPDAGPPVGSLSCVTYCTEIQENCQLPFQQYDSMEQCMSTCADMDLGTENDASGNTVGCRIWHVRKGVMQGALDVHCNHAGPTGGLVCGGFCDNLCSRANKLCVTANNVDNPPYDSYEDCMSKCEPDAEGNGGYPVADQIIIASGDSVNCRIFHLGNAYKYLGNDETLLNVHCRHTAEFSDTCQ